jgi:hypothetical protein
MVYSTEKEQIKIANKQIASLVSGLKIEKLLYANMKKVLKKREDEIASLYSIINDLMTQ